MKHNETLFSRVCVADSYSDEYATRDSRKVPLSPDGDTDERSHMHKYDTHNMLTFAMEEY